MAKSRDDDQRRTARPVSGTVRVWLGVAAGRIARVSIENARLTGPFPMLHGQDTEAAVARLAALFPVCGLAHRHVARAAIAAAEGRNARCRMEVACELLGEYALSQVWRAAVDWPRVMGEAPRLDPLKTARAALAAADRDSMAQALAGAVFDGAPPVPGAVSAWLETAATAGARICRAARGMATEAVLPAALGPRDAMWFGRRLTEDPGFAARPQTETGPADPSRPAQTERFGPVAARMVGQHLQALETLAALASGRGLFPDAAALSPGRGAAVVATARGPLAALVACDGGRVTDLRLSAPSEWALHPEGTLVRLIRGAPENEAETRARLAVAACDPCAEVEILREAA